MPQRTNASILTFILDCTRLMVYWNTRGGRPTMNTMLHSSAQCERAGLHAFYTQASSSYSGDNHTHERWDPLVTWPANVLAQSAWLTHKREPLTHTNDPATLVHEQQTPAHYVRMHALLSAPPHTRTTRPSRLTPSMLHALHFRLLLLAARPHTRTSPRTYACKAHTTHAHTCAANPMHTTTNWYCSHLASFCCKHGSKLARCYS
jgi:hypothetical protein